MQVCALERTDKAYDGFYRRCEEGPTKKGYPRHRKRIGSLSWKLRKQTKVVRRKTDTADKKTIRVRENPIRKTVSCQFCGTVLDRDHNAAINILLRAAAALRGEWWVSTLTEARNKNEARDEGLQNATQLLLFDAMTSPSL